MRQNTGRCLWCSRNWLTDWLTEWKIKREFAPHCRIDRRNKFSKLKILFRKTNMGQKVMPFVGLSLWNILVELIKKLNVKNYCLNWINNELMKWVFHCYYFKGLAILTYISFFILWLYLSIFFFHLSLMFLSLRRGTTMKIRHFCPFLSPIPSISIAFHISVTISNF